MGLALGVMGLGCGVMDLGFEVIDLGFGARETPVSNFRGCECGGWGQGFRIQGAGIGACPKSLNPSPPRPVLAFEWSNLLGARRNPARGCFGASASIRDTVRAPYSTFSGRDCVKSLRLCLHGIYSQRVGGWGLRFEI